MKIDYIKSTTLFCMLITTSFEFSYSQTLEEIIEGKHRSKENKARDQYRAPLETLKFFGIKNTMTVVEIYPGESFSLDPQPKVDEKYKKKFKKN